MTYPGSRDSSDSLYQVHGTSYLVPGTCSSHQVTEIPGTRYQLVARYLVPGSIRLVPEIPGTWYQMPDIGHMVLNTW